jgi:hypothetical protein
MSRPSRLEGYRGGMERRSGRHHVIDQQDGAALYLGVGPDPKGAGRIEATMGPRQLGLGPGGAGAAQGPALPEPEASRQRTGDLEGLIEAAREMPAPVQRDRRDQVCSRQFASCCAGDDGCEMATQIGETVVLEMLHHGIERMPVEKGRHQAVEGGWLVTTSGATIAGRNVVAGNRLGADVAGEFRSLQSTSTGDTKPQLGTPGCSRGAASEAGRWQNQIQQVQSVALEALMRRSVQERAFWHQGRSERLYTHGLH